MAIVSEIPEQVNGNAKSGHVPISYLSRGDGPESDVVLTKAGWRQVVRRLRAGESIRQVAADYGLSESHVRLEWLVASTPKGKPVLADVKLFEIQPSPENADIYRPLADDPGIQPLADSIRANGLLERIIISSDGYIISGHRRHAACELAGLETVPCLVLPVRRTDDIDRFVRLLREHNRQRDKTRAEKLREELVEINPSDAYEALIEYRREQAAIDVAPLAIVGKLRRAAISDAKAQFLDAIQEIIWERRQFWPLSDRQVHYALLNDPPLIHAAKPSSRYQNTKTSYRSLVDVLTRARLSGSIPFEAIGDETRPVQVWHCHTDPRSFVSAEIKRMFGGYWRALQQSQPNHVEIVGEKNTVASILKPVAAEFCIPLTTGRGYCSLPPRGAMAQRFRDSGKSTLILLLVTDFDPDGQEIAHSFARSMRDDFGIDAIHPVKVALTATQVAEHNLPPMMHAKKSSVHHAKFVGEHGHNVFELEALAPQALQKILRQTIESVIDRAAFDAEVAAERGDAAHLEALRRTVRKALGGLKLEVDADE